MRFDNVSAFCIFYQFDGTVSEIDIYLYLHTRNKSPSANDESYYVKNVERQLSDWQVVRSS